MNPRILVITHSFPEHRSGLVIAAGEIAARAARRGADVRWLAGGPLTESLGEGVCGVPIPQWYVLEKQLGITYPFWGPTGFKRLFDEVRRSDLVHIHDAPYIGSVCAWLFARALGRRVIVTQRIGAIPFESRILRWLHEAGNRSVGSSLLADADQTVFYSHEVQDYFTRFARFRRPPVFIENGVHSACRPLEPDERRSLRRKLGLPEGRKIILFVGRFVERKGMKLMRELCRTFAEHTWVFIGWGVDDPKGWGLPPESALCVGSLPQTEVFPYYQAADLLVLPSVGEGFPLVVQESMACGTPALISTETAAALPGIEKVLFVSARTPDALSTMIRRLAGNPSELEAQRPIVAAFAQRQWQWERCADAYWKILTEGKKPAAP